MNFDILLYCMDKAEKPLVLCEYPVVRILILILFIRNVLYGIPILLVKLYRAGHKYLDGLYCHNGVPS